jgi:hypothetical protein
MLRFGHGAGRNADQFPRAEESPGGRDCAVLLAEMNAIGSASVSQLRIVVDDQDRPA